MVSLCYTNQVFFRFFVRGLPFGRPSWVLQGPASFFESGRRTLVELVFAAVALARALGWSLILTDFFKKLVLSVL